MWICPAPISLRPTPIAPPTGVPVREWRTSPLRSAPDCFRIPPLCPRRPLEEAASPADALYPGIAMARGGAAHTRGLTGVCEKGTPLD